MLHFPDDLTQARILISNDDGIHSDGISALEDAAKAFTDKVWVVAPEHEQSAAGHSLTIHSPLRIKKYDEKHVSVFGTPTDCVLMGVQHVMKSEKPDLLISGINHGQNAADDVTYSGTIAAAIEATLLGIPAVAFSQSAAVSNENDAEYNWDIVGKMSTKILQKLQGFTWDNHILLNVNFPVASSLTEDTKIVVIPQGHYHMSDNSIIPCEDPRGRPYFWIGPPEYGDKYEGDTDIGALQNNFITITPLTLNFTHEKTLKELENLFT